MRGDVLDISDITQQLDHMIAQSHRVLSAVEEKQWDNFIGLEVQRQQEFEKIKKINFPKETQIIERLDIITKLNKLILSHSKDFQDNLNNKLQNNRNKQSLDKAYKQ